MSFSIESDPSRVVKVCLSLSEKKKRAKFLAVQERRGLARGVRRRVVANQTKNRPCQKEARPKHKWPNCTWPKRASQSGMARVELAQVGSRNWPK